MALLSFLLFSFETDAPNFLSCAPKIFSCVPKILAVSLKIYIWYGTKLKFNLWALIIINKVTIIEHAQ